MKISPDFRPPAITRLYKIYRNAEQSILNPKSESSMCSEITLESASTESRLGLTWYLKLKVQYSNQHANCLVHLLIYRKE